MKITTDVNTSFEEGKRFKFQVHFIIHSRDFFGPIGSNVTYVHLLKQAKCEFKDLTMQPKIA